jgi:hypothetical protein
MAFMPKGQKAQNSVWNKWGNPTILTLSALMLYVALVIL